MMVLDYVLNLGELSISIEYCKTFIHGLTCVQHQHDGKYKGKLHSDVLIIAMAIHATSKEDWEILIFYYLVYFENLSYRVRATGRLFTAITHISRLVTGRLQSQSEQSICKHGV